MKKTQVLQLFLSCDFNIDCEKTPLFLLSILGIPRYCKHRKYNKKLSKKDPPMSTKKMTKKNEKMKKKTKIKIQK